MIERKRKGRLGTERKRDRKREKEEEKITGKIEAQRER